MGIYTVYNCYFGYYDVNMLVKAENAREARKVAKTILRDDYRNQCYEHKPSSTTKVLKCTDEFIREMDLRRELAAIKRRPNGSFLIYDEGT